MLKFILTILLFIPFVFGANDEWSYLNPKQWVRKNRYCAGHLQSPINLQYNISQHDQRLKPLYLDDQHSHEQAELFNSGHTVQLNIKNHYLLKNVAPASEDYKVEQVHFHWGHSNDNHNGSEHLHEGQPYPLEMHMVTYSSLYPNIRQAMSNIHGLAVVGVFFEVSDEPNPLLQPLIDALKNVRGQNDRTPVGADFNLKSLLNGDRMSRYYRYDGSLTTPPCYESVIWTVLLDPIKISLTQLHAFRYLHDAKAHLIENTYRPVKPLGSRILYRSFFSKDFNEDQTQRKMSIENNGQYLKNNMKLIVTLISLLIILF